MLGEMLDGMLDEMLVSRERMGANEAAVSEFAETSGDSA